MTRLARSRIVRNLGLSAAVALVFVLLLTSGGSVVFADVFSWIQDTQADFQSDTLTNTDADAQPGSVLLQESDALSVDGVSGWRFRRQMTIDNNAAEVLPTGYSVKLVLDTESLVDEGKLRADGNDLRVVWDNGGTLVELDRVAETDFDSPNTEIWFKTQAQIPGNGSDGEYYIYYGNASAGAPPADRGQVYPLWDDFEGSSLDSRWTDSGSIFLASGVAYLGTGAYIIDTTAFTYGVLDMRLKLGEDDDKAWWGWEASAANAGNMVVFQEYPPSTRDFTGLTRRYWGSYYRESLPDPSPGGLTTWHTYTIDWWSGNARWLTDGVEAGSTTSGVPSVGIYALVNASQVPMQLDWVKARLRVTVEPSVTLGAPQVGYASQGQVLSIAYDTGFFSGWRQLTWDASTPTGTDISLRVRTAATQAGLASATWVDYPQSGLSMTNDPGRWVQYEATLTTADPLETPALHKVEISYEDLPATLTISPDDHTVVAGQTVNYSAIVDDGNGSWDVTGETDFSIDAGAGGVWSDNAYTSAAAGDWTVTGQYANLEDTGTLHVMPATDLSVSKTSSADEVRVGQPFTYTIAVTNNGPSVAEDVSVTDDLPEDVAFISATSSQGSGCSGTSTVVCPLGDLNDGATATVAIVVAPTATGMIENTAEAAGSDPSGNPLTASDSASITGVQSDIAIAKLPDMQTVSSGSPVTFTIVVTNASNVALTDLTVTDDLPEADDCSRSLGSLAAGASVSYQCTMHGEDVMADFVNRATVAGSTPLGDEVTATDTATVLIESAPSPSEGTVFLPFILSGFGAPTPAPVSAPDLVVEQLTVAADGVQVVIKNQGNAPVPTSDVFWVDLYIDPDPVPTAVNQTWEDGRCAEGMVWGISAPALPLDPGDTLTLTYGDAYYWPEYSNFSGSIPAAVAVYAQVDSANLDSTHGAVLEGHEIEGEAYNNITGPTYLTVGLDLTTSGTETPVTADGRSVTSQSMPPRP